MDEQPLYWDSSYEIVLALMELHAGVDLDGIGIGELHQLIVSLPNFADDPLMSNDGILTEILREWYEESSEWN